MLVVTYGGSRNMSHCDFLIRADSNIHNEKRIVVQCRFAVRKNKGSCELHGNLGGFRGNAACHYQKGS